MSLIYKSKRVGKNGVPFDMFKFKTLQDNVDKISSFATDEQYTRFGKFLRKTKIDELPQLWNVVKGDMRIFGYRAEEEKTFKVLPEAIKSILTREKPGIIDLSSLAFMDEEELLKLGDAHETYWMKVRPLKFTLQAFYIENRSWLLNSAIVYIYLKKMLWSLIKK